MSKYTTFDFNLLNENFYEFNKESLLRSKSLVNRLSSSSIDYAKISSEEDFLKKAITYLTKLSYGLFTYVTKEKTPNIIFDYKGSSSYCSLTENTIVISLNLILNTLLPYQLRIDSTLGIVLHEFFHKRFTVSDIINHLSIPKENYYNPKGHTQNSIKKEKFLKENLSSKLKSTIVNILEDRRIERLGLIDFPGYGFFLEESRKLAFYLQKDRTVSKQNLTFLIIDYILIKVLLPELEEETILKNFKRKGIKDYSSISPIFVNSNKELLDKKIFDTINKIKKYLDDLDHNKVNTLNDVLEHTDRLIALIPEELNKVLNPESEDSGNNNNKGYDYSSITEPLKGVTGFDPSEDKKELSDDFISDLEKIKEETITETLTLSENKIKKETKIHLNNKEFKKYKEIKIIEDPIITRYNQKIFSEAQRLSTDLCSTLAFLEEKYNRKNYYYELNEGELDEDELYSINYNENIFFNEEEVRGYALTLGILLDESNSMRDKIKDVMLAAFTLAFSVENNKHIDLFIYGHSTECAYEESYNYDETITLYKYYNSIEGYTNINKLYNITNRANNIDGFAIEQMGEIMKTSNNKRKVLIVVSDGQPNGMNYGGKPAIKHTRQKIVELQSEGFFIIQVCMDNIEESNLMFDNFIEFKEKENFISNMKNILLKELDQFFLEI